MNLQNSALAPGITQAEIDFNEAMQRAVELGQPFTRELAALQQKAVDAAKHRQAGYGRGLLPVRL